MIYIVAHIGDIGKKRTKFVFISVVDFAVDAIHFFFDLIDNGVHIFVGDCFFTALVQPRSISRT